VALATNARPRGATRYGRIVSFAFRKRTRRGKVDACEVPAIVTGDEHRTVQFARGK